MHISSRIQGRSKRVDRVTMSWGPEGPGGPQLKRTPKITIGLGPITDPEGRATHVHAHPDDRYCINRWSVLKTFNFAANKFIYL